MHEKRNKPVMTKNNEYMSNGVTITPAVPTAGETIKLKYDGLLAKSGGSDILAHVGFGDNWEGVYDYRMDRISTGFEVSLAVAETNTLNICFKDCANHWDNNEGKNYYFDIS